MPERLYSSYQVADLLGAAASEVSEWIRRGWLSAERDGDGAVRISEHALVAFLKQRGIDIEAVMAQVVAGESRPRRDVEDIHEAQVVSAWPAQPPLLESLPAVEPAAAVGPADASASAEAAAKVAQAVIKDAVARRASHIHLNLGPDGLTLRLRIDGVLHDKDNFSRRLPRALGPWVVERFEALAGAGAVRGRGPRDGRFVHSVDGREMGLHLSACPTLNGEKLVIHLLERLRELPQLDRLGLDAQDEGTIRRALAEPAGLVLAAGPACSGTTTTLLAMLGALPVGEREIAVIEDSVEVRADGVVQSLPGAGLSYAEALRAFAAQDADVIVVGRIGSPAVARAAVEAALGRLVLGAVRAGGAAAAAGALLEMGVEAEALSSALIAVVAQRLVPRLCDQCKRKAAPPAGLLKEMGLPREELGAPAFAARGCPRCSRSGYSGRTGVFSVLKMDQALAALLRSGAGVEAIQQAASRHGAKPLRQAALEKVRAGVTSLEQIASVVRGE